MQQRALQHDEVSRSGDLVSERIARHDVDGTAEALHHLGIVGGGIGPVPVWRNPMTP